MIKRYFVLIMLTVVAGHFAIGQGTLVNAGGTLKDRFSKKTGNLMFSATTLKMGRIKNNSVKTDTIKIYNSGNSTITLSLEKVPAHMTVNLQSASLTPNSETLISVMFDAAKRNDYGFVLDSF